MRTLFAIVITVTLVFILIWTKPESQAELQPLPAARVLSTEVRRMDIRPVTNLTGKLQPARRAELRFELSGRITERLIEPGQVVTAGETLLQIDDGDFIDKYNEAIALLEQERNAVARDRSLLDLIIEERELQKREVERLNQLGQVSLASKSNYDASLQGLLKLKAEESRLRHSVDTASSRVRTREAAVSQARRNLDRTRLVAPFNATINRVNLEVGDYANAGQFAVGIVQLHPLDLYLEVTGHMVASLSLGQKVDVVIAEQPSSGEIVAIESDPQSETLTHAIRIRIDESGYFPGQIAEVSLPGATLKDVAVVPTTAVLHEDGQAYVFEVKEDHLHKKTVKLLARYEDWQSVRGISAGTPVVARDVAALADGQQVTVEHL